MVTLVVRRAGIFCKQMSGIDEREYMELITRQQHIDDIPNRWHVQYGHTMDSCHGYRYADKYALLKAEVPLTKKKADEIIGNDSWSTLECSGCDAEDPDAIVIVAEVDGYPVYLCRECLVEAMGLIDKKEGSNEG